MKKFRLLAAMVITVVMLFTVAYAAEVSFDAIEYNGTDDTVTFVVKANNDLAVDAYSTLAIDYDKDIYTVASKTSSFDAAEITDYVGRIEWCNPSGDAAIAKGDAMLTVVFNVVDKDAVVGSTFATNADMTFVSAFNAGGDILDMATSVTVEAATPVVPPFVAETIKGAIVEGTDDVVLEKDPASSYKNTYLGTAVFAAELGADVKYSEAGFIWVNNDTETEFKFVATDDEAVSGEGTFEYAVAMFAIPDGVDIDAIPYYVTAE